MLPNQEPYRMFACSPEEIAWFRDQIAHKMAEACGISLDDAAARLENTLFWEKLLEDPAGFLHWFSPESAAQAALQGPGSQPRQAAPGGA